MRYRLRAGERSSKYRSGQYVSATYAARFPHKVQAGYIPARPRREIPAPAAVPEEWEVTVRYRSSGQVVDMTVRIMVPPEFAPAKPSDIRKAAWRVVHGHALDKYEFAGVDWRREYKGKGRGKSYEGESDNPEDATSFKGMFRTVGFDNLRVAYVEA